MIVDRAAMYAYILSKISKESMGELYRYPDFELIEADRDPLALWLAIKNTHQVLTMSKVAYVVKKSAREEYMSCKQGSYESIVDYKHHFDSKLDAYTASGNPKIPDEDVAMDFMYGLDNSRYAEFKAEIVNNIVKDAIDQPKELNTMYVLASRQVVIRNNQATVGGATLTTLEEGRNKGNWKMGGKNKGGKNKGGKSQEENSNKENKKKDKYKNATCFNCNQKGHLARDCPGNNGDDKEEETRMTRMAYIGC